jgi:hypothetical protein
MSMHRVRVLKGVPSASRALPGRSNNTLSDGPFRSIYCQAPMDLVRHLEQPSRLRHGAYWNG